MNRVVIALGSNIDPEINIQKALKALKQKYTIQGESGIQRTKCFGDATQADFLNSAVLIETEMETSPLKAELKQIETQLGRAIDHDHNGPRTIDLDIVVWNETIIDRDFYQRDYLKKSALELIPNLKY